MARGFFLFNLPDVVGFEEFREVVILLLRGNLVKLSVNRVVIGWSIHVANHSEGDGESIFRRHHRELQLQGVILAMGIVNENVIDGIAVLTDLHNLQAEALLYESELVVLAEHELLAVLYVDGVLLTTFVIKRSDRGHQNRARRDGRDPPPFRKGST